jgi:hypothetical protein
MGRRRGLKREVGCIDGFIADLIGLDLLRSSGLLAGLALLPNVGLPADNLFQQFRVERFWLGCELRGRRRLFRQLCDMSALTGLGRWHRDCRNRIGPGVCFGALDP